MSSVKYKTDFLHKQKSPQLRGPIISTHLLPNLPVGNPLNSLGADTCLSWVSSAHWHWGQTICSVTLLTSTS